MRFDILFLFQEGLLQGPGDPDSYTNYTLQILGMLLVAFILGYLLRFFIGAKWKTLAQSLENEINGYKKKANQLELDLNTCKYEREKLSGEVKTLKNQYNDTLLQLKACHERLGEDTPLAGAIPPYASRKLDYGKAFTQDQLQIIEGIGPKIEKALKDQGINTWADIAAKNGDELSQLLVDTNPNFRIHDASSWPQQAKLAQQGKWDQLIVLQKGLGGDGSGNTDAKAEKLAAKILGVTLYKPDDLKVVEGIGPKIESLLKDNGIHDWDSLADTTADQLNAILAKAGDNFKLADPSTWPEQARMAAKGEWKKLEEYQEFLQGGKDLS